MPELAYHNTTAIPPETLLARAIAEYVQVTRATLADIRALRHGFIAPDPELGTCSHETRISVLMFAPVRRAGDGLQLRQ